MIVRPVDLSDLDAMDRADDEYARPNSGIHVAELGTRVRIGPQRKIHLGVDLARVVDEAVTALSADPDLYVRAGALTRVVASDGTEAPSQAIKRASGAPVMRRCPPTWIRERLSLLATFTATRTRGRSRATEPIEVETQPPPWVAIHVVERSTWLGYRPLWGVVTAPTVRRDGSVLQMPGYDGPSGILYVPRGAFPAVDDQPTKVLALRARDALLEVIEDFDLDDTGRACWLALVLTLVARDLVDGPVPLFAFDAPTPGAGKGLLVGCAHRIAFGGDAAHMSLPEDDAEMRKQITTSLLSGDPAILLDNVSVPLGGDSLDAVITAPVWKVRLLGKTEDSGELVPRAVWIVTGNGLELIGDLGRRTLRIRLVPRCERPEERTEYRHPERRGVDALLAWVDSQRPRLVHAALTCVRAWVVDGRPAADVAYFGSFEGWAKSIAACVAWLGLPDPTRARASRDAMLDPKRAALAALFAAVHRYQNTSGVSARELVGYAFPLDGPADEDLAGALGVLLPDRPRLDQRAHALGNRLRAARDRILDVDLATGRTSLRLSSEPGRAGLLRWRVVAC